MTSNGYRTLTIKSVRRLPSDDVTLKFEESSLELDISRSHPFSKGADDLVAGDKVEVKGRKGNTDVDLWGINKVEDIRRAQQEGDTAWGTWTERSEKEGI